MTSTGSSRTDNNESSFPAAEFYLVVAETAFIESLEEFMKVMDYLIKHVTSKVVGKCTDGVQTLCSAAGNEDSLLSVLFHW